MNTKSYLNKLKLLSKDDVEQSHIEADKILCNILIEHGHLDIVSEYEKLDKWYS